MKAELGASYDDLDRDPVRPGRPPLERRTAASRAGLDAALVAWVGAAVARKEFKRQVPPVAKVSLRTPGIDHLYPRRRPGSRPGAGEPGVAGSWWSARRSATWAT